MEFNELKSHSKSKSKRWVGLSLVALVVIGGLVYYTWPREVAGEDTPPVLETSNSALQGYFVDDTIQFLNYESEDEKVFKKFKDETTNFSDTFGAPTDIESGIHFYSFKSDRNWKFAFDAFKPVDGNKVLFFFYSPGKEEDYGYTAKGFYVFPKGPFKGTFEIKEEDLDSKIIPAGRILGVISELGVDKTYKDEDGKEVPYAVMAYGYQGEKDPATVFKPLDNTLSGWVQVALPETPKEAIASISDRIALNSEGKMQIWIQDKVNNFKRVDLKNLNSEIGQFRRAWLKLNPKVEFSKPPEQIN